MLASVVYAILEVALQLFLEVICYALGRLIVPVISFGRWTCDSLGTSRPQRTGRHRRPTDVGNGRIHLSVEATQLIGFIAIVLVVGVIIYLSLAGNP